MIEGSYDGFVAPRGFAGKDGSKYNKCGRNRVTCIMRNCKRLRVKTARQLSQNSTTCFRSKYRVRHAMI